MNQIFHHVDDWECAKHGMYREHKVLEADLARAVSALTKHCRPAMSRVVSEWPRSCEQVFTDTGKNRRAWFGRAAVFIWTDLPESVTRAAWFLLSPDERATANVIANEIIADWERTHTRRTSCQNDLWE